MERDFLGLGSKLFVKEETKDDSGAAPSRGIMEWSLSKKAGPTPQFISFGTPQQDRLINSVNAHLLPFGAITPTSVVVDQNRRTHYSSLQELRMFPISSQHDQTTITASISTSGAKSFINNQPWGGSPIMAAPAPVSVFPSPINIRSSSKPPPSQLTIFYAGSVSVYKDISLDKAQDIMFLAGNGPQTKPVLMSTPQEPIHHSPTSFASMRNHQPDAFNMAPAVCLPQSRKASLARFLEKRKERIINVSPYYVSNKSSIECKTPISECVSSRLSSSSAIRPI